MIRIVAYESADDSVVDIAIGTWKSDQAAMRSVRKDKNKGTPLRVQEFFLEEPSANLSILEQIARTANDHPPEWGLEDRTLGEVLEVLVKTAFEFGREFERSQGD